MILQSLFLLHLESLENGRNPAAKSTTQLVVVSIGVTTQVEAEKLKPQ
jgi:hypothetical protein